MADGRLPSWAEEAVDVEGRRVVLRRAGPPGDGRDPVVVLHDAGAESVDAAAWALLAERVPVAQVLLPGVGGSDAVPPDGGLPWVTRLLAGVLEQTCAGPAVLVGTSLGGWFALETALAHPAAVGHLVLLDTAGLHAPPDHLLRLFADGQGQGGRDGLIGPLMARHGVADDPASLGPAAAAPYVGQMAAAALQSWSPHAPHPSLLARVPALRVPTAIAWGAEDALIPVAHGQVLAEAIGVALHVVADAGHLLAVDAPGAVADLVAGLAGGERLPSPAACPSTRTD